MESFLRDGVGGIASNNLGDSHFFEDTDPPVKIKGYLSSTKVNVNTNKSNQISLTSCLFISYCVHVDFCMFCASAILESFHFFSRFMWLFVCVAMIGS